MKPRLLAAAFASLTLHAASLSVAFPFERIPNHLWSRELVWLKNIGVSSVVSAAAPASALQFVARAGLTATAESKGTTISVLSTDALVRSRRAMIGNGAVVWTDVETESTPVFHRGGVALDGEENPAVQILRREAELMDYWAPVLASSQKITIANSLPEYVLLDQKVTSEASAVSLINSGAKPWQGDIQVALPSYKRNIRIAGVSVPANDALLLPVDVAFNDPRFCRFCSGMSNSERLLYATAELTTIEYENGILSFEFYAPSSGVAVLQLEREPNGPMLAAGHPVEFQWDAENKRAKLPIPAGKGANKRVRIAVTITAPDDVASFVNTRTLIIGETNHILTDYSSEAFAKRSRLIVPAGWKCTSEVKSPTQVEYALEVPKERLHGEREDLRLEANGIGMSHVRVQLLRPVSVHVAEAAAVHFGDVAEMVASPPLIPVESPNGRTISVQLRNNAPEIRTFQVALTGDQLEFSPLKSEISIGPMMEREITFRAFTKGASPGLHEAAIQITGAATYSQPARFVVLPRGESVTYSADVTGAGQPQSIWENAQIRAVFSKDNGRWLDFYWKASGASLLPAEGVAIGHANSVRLSGSELVITGASNLPRGGKIGTVEWKAGQSGDEMRYEITDAASHKM